ncbi:MAG: DUF2281 domain-containing protein [Microscillaceae bacterium]|jgi:hypothetical protein|nr:DUF2281 domain-containing protein [Microscillaceae bacterium]
METSVLLAKFSILNVEAQQELLDFLEYLSQKQEKIRTTAQASHPLVFGELAGSFKMSTDFDAPLEDFKEYM